MKKDNLKSIVVLSVICLVTAAVLGAVNYISAPIIAKNAEKAVRESLREVLTEAEEFVELELPDGTPESITGIYQDPESKSYAITAKTKTTYSKGSYITFTLGISPEGKIIGNKITNYPESKDFKNYPDSFTGLDREGATEVDTYSGVTISSTAYKAAVDDAFKAFALVSGGPTAEEASLEKVLGEGAELQELELTDKVPETVKAIYKDLSGGGYAVLLETFSEYSKEPMAFTVGIGVDGLISGIEITNYKDSKSLGDYPDSFIGVGEDLSGIDIETDVTYSSTAFRNAVEDAFKGIKEVGK